MHKGALLLVLVTLNLLGCISAHPPTVEVVGAEVTETGPDASRVEVLLMLSNPNDISLPLKQVSYQVSVEGAEPYAYVDLPARVLPPNGVQSVRLPAVVTESEGESLSGASWRVSGTVTYVPENQLRAFLTETGVPLPLALFSARGVLE